MFTSKLVFCVAGPTNGDFDTSIRKFTKTHTLGSFGKSFTGDGDHSGLMNKVYSRLRNNGAGHYNKEPSPNDNYPNTNSNKQRYSTRNRYNSHKRPSRNSRYNNNRNYDPRNKRQYNPQSNRNSYKPPSQISEESFDSSSVVQFPKYGSSPHNKDLFPDDLFDFSDSQFDFKKSQDSYYPGYDQSSQSPRRDESYGSEYHRRPNTPYFRRNQKSSHYPKRKQYKTPPQFLSSNYKGIIDLFQQ